MERSRIQLPDRTALVAALKDAAELEHQLMLQYLYAGFSLKRDPDDTCTPAQYEVVRRWSSTLFMIARQEMEHLSLANGMLTAIGEPVHFARPNIGPRGLLSPYFTSATLALGLGDGEPTPVPLRYAFDPFRLETVGRFVCGESPPFNAFRPPQVPPPWCFSHAGQDDALLTAVGDDVPLARTWLEAPASDALAPAASGELAAGTVQDLYEAIRAAFLRMPGLFVRSPPEVVIPVEYNVFVFPVTDQRSAIGAIDIILEQGEGLADPWNLDSHFRRFSEIHEELCGMQPPGARFEPAYRMLSNPQRDQIAYRFTGEVFDLVNHAYRVLLLILTGLYQRAVPPGAESYPYLSAALSENAFAPTMTMIVRALNEILVLLPIGPDGRRTGSNWYIDPRDRELIELLEHPNDRRLDDIDLLYRRWQEMTQAIRDAATHAKSVPADELGSAPPKKIAHDLTYVYESAHRAGANLRGTYQFGLYPKYVNI